MLTIDQRAHLEARAGDDLVDLILPDAAENFTRCRNANATTIFTKTGQRNGDLTPVGCFLNVLVLPGRAFPHPGPGEVGASGACRNYGVGGAVQGGTIPYAEHT